MTEFFAPTIPSDGKTFDKLRVHMIDSDNMEPSLCKPHYVLILPIDSYQGEGIYLIDNRSALCVYRVSPAIEGGLILWVDNPLYPHKTIVARDKFNEHVIGIVVADIKVREERFLQRH